MYLVRRIDVNEFEEVVIETYNNPELDVSIETLYGRATVTLTVNEAKRLRNYLTEVINVATLNKEEELK